MCFFLRADVPFSVDWMNKSDQFALQFAWILLPTAQLTRSYVYFHLSMYFLVCVLPAGVISFQCFCWIVDNNPCLHAAPCHSTLSNVSSIPICFRKILSVFMLIFTKSIVLTMTSPYVFNFHDVVLHNSSFNMYIDRDFPLNDTIFNSDIEISLLRRWNWQKT